MAGLLRTTINDPRIIACDTELQLGLSIAALEEQDRVWWETAEMVLGTVWTADQFKDEEERVVLAPNGMPARQTDQSEKPKKKSDKVRIPLLMGMRPELQKHLHDLFKGRTQTGTLGDGSSLQGAQSLFNLSKEEYLSFVHNAHGQVHDKNLGIKREPKKK